MVDQKRLSEWSSLVIGKKIDFDGKFGYQCVDLARHYLRFMGLDQFKPVAGARDIAAQYADAEDSIKCRDGALLISMKGTYGHVAVALKVCGTSALVVEQDGFKQDGAKLVFKSLLSFDKCVNF